MDMNLIGTTDAKVDAKGRVFLPAMFRRALGGGEGMRLIMRKDVFEDCLVLYTEDEWNRRVDELRARLSMWKREDQRLLRSYMTGVEWLTLDGGGRILLPKRYLQMAGIEQDVTFIGMYTTIEIWAKDRRQDGEAANLGDELEAKMSTRQGDE